ncbi:hypothetical protein JCM19992_31540 [Thermostilla marina]
MRRLCLLLLLVFFGAGFPVCERSATGQTTNSPEPFRIVIADPLCRELACDCVAGYADRDYTSAAAVLEDVLGRPVELIYAESLLLPQAGDVRKVDLVVGKYGEMAADLKRLGLSLRPTAFLTDENGDVCVEGLVVVRRDDPARGMVDLTDRRILLGPPEADEKHGSALALMEAFAISTSAPQTVSPSCASAALAVVEREADAAVISSYAMPLVEGCGTVDKGALRVLIRTDPVPFITVFAVDLNTRERAALLEAFERLKHRPQALAALKSREGFTGTSYYQASAAARRWTDWRGERRLAVSPHVPVHLPTTKRLLWSRTLTGPGMSGLAAAEGCLVVADKDLTQTHDVWHCLDADTGAELWRVTWPAEGELDFTNSPRANPVICGNDVYLLGAFGELACVKLESGEVVWRRNIIEDFGAEPPTWGTCSTPLVVDDLLIVNPGNTEASVVALDRRSGKEVWRSPGDGPGYGSFVLARPTGRPQIVGHDAVSLCGWDPDDGRRLWRIVPEFEGDFNVPTPIAVGDDLWVTTENNGTRRFRWSANQPEPILKTHADALAPDISTPVIVGDFLLGCDGKLVCLDKTTLETCWTLEEEPLRDYAALIAGDDRVLIVTQQGAVYLVRPTRERPEVLGRMSLFDDVADVDREVWSHPIVLPGRLYVRNLLGVYCFLLE